MSPISKSKICENSCRRDGVCVFLSGFVLSKTCRSLSPMSKICESETYESRICVSRFSTSSFFSSANSFF
jgi:hypothetical protein